MRTDDHNNPTAFTTDIARIAGLVLGTDYEQGAPFTMQGVGFGTLFTARLLGDPIEITKRVIDKLGFRTAHNLQRWTYISLPRFVWSGLTDAEKLDVIGFMYQQEGGTAMRNLFPNYGRQ